MREFDRLIRGRVHGYARLKGTSKDDTEMHLERLGFAVGLFRTLVGEHRPEVREG